MRAITALKLTVEQRLGFEMTLARARIERAYARMQSDLHEFGKYPDSTMIELHEAEQILHALERVSGAFYRCLIENMKTYGDEQKQRAKEDAAYAVEVAASRSALVDEQKGRR